MAVDSGRCFQTRYAVSPGQVAKQPLAVNYFDTERNLFIIVCGCSLVWLWAIRRHFWLSLFFVACLSAINIYQNQPQHQAPSIFSTSHQSAVNTNDKYFDSGNVHPAHPCYQEFEAELRPFMLEWYRMNLPILSSVKLW
jgi:hypothetical protein